MLWLIFSLSGQIIRWPVSCDHIARSGQELIEETLFKLTDFSIGSLKVDYYSGGSAIEDKFRHKLNLDEFWLFFRHISSSIAFIKSPWYIAFVYTVRSTECKIFARNRKCVSLFVSLFINVYIFILLFFSADSTHFSRFRLNFKFRQSKLELTSATSATVLGLNLFLKSKRIDEDSDWNSIDRIWTPCLEELKMTAIWAVYLILV